MKDLFCRFVIGLIILLIIPFLLIYSKEERSENREMEESFMNPPLENRPMAMWPWLNGYIDTTRLIYELEEMKAKGMRGVFIWDVGAIADPQKMIPAGPAYLGPQSVSYISLALRTAKRIGLDLGLMTSSSWNAGGAWVPETEGSMQLLSTSQVITGPSTKAIHIGVPHDKNGAIESYHLITSVAFPYTNDSSIDYSQDKIIRLDENTSEDKMINWQAPTGKWSVLSFFMCNTDQPLECPSPNSGGLMIDHLSNLATKNYFDTLLTRLSKVSTSDNHLKFFELDSYELWPAKDWTPAFLKEFKNRYGYDPVPFLPLLEGYKCKDGIVGERFLGDFGRLVSDLIIENHFAQSVDIASKHGMKMFIEGGHGGYARVDPLKALGNSDVPMGEFWNRKQFWVTKEAASGAHIYGKQIVAAESLTGWQNWQHGPTDFKQLLDIAFCEGLNQVVFHNFAHSPEIAGKPGFAYHAGEHINVNTTWWPMARPFMDYISRCSYLLRQGNFVGDVCLYYGDQAPNLVPPDRIDPNITPLYDDNHCLHCGQLKPIVPGKLTGYDYDYMNADVITSRMKVENGRLVLPSGQSYRMMEIPDRDDISLDVLKKLDTLIYNGAVIIGPKPQRATSLKNFPECDQEVKSIARKIWGKCDGKTIVSAKYGKGTIYWGKSVKQVLDDLHIPPDMEVTGVDNSDSHIDYLHRKTLTEEIYFLSNSRPQSQSVTCVFRVDKNMVPEIWDAETGLIQRKVTYSKVGNGIMIDFKLDPLGSRFVVFKNNSTGNNDPGLHYNLQYGFDGLSISSKNYALVDVSKNWNVRFDTAWGAPDFYHLDSLVSWTAVANEGINYYSGMATYEKDFTIEKNQFSGGTPAFVVFDDIQEVARVLVNGHGCGIVWTRPYKADITNDLKPGVNHLTIQVINAWNNRIVGDMRTPNKREYTRTNIKFKFKPQTPLLESGLIGNAKIVLMKKETD